MGLNKYSLILPSSRSDALLKFTANAHLSIHIKCPPCFYLCCPKAACHKERHVSQKAVSFIHDVLTEVLTSWAELPHFHFNEALFRPFEHIMQLELCDEDVQDQVRPCP